MLLYLENEIPTARSQLLPWRILLLKAKEVLELKVLTISEQIQGFRAGEWRSVIKNIPPGVILSCTVVSEIIWECEYRYVGPKLPTFFYPLDFQKVSFSVSSALWPRCHDLHVIIILYVHILLLFLSDWKPSGANSAVVRVLTTGSYSAYLKFLTTRPWRLLASRAVTEHYEISALYFL